MLHDNARQFEWMCKFLIVGDSAVGKTNLLLRFCDDTYTENHITTIGIDFKFKEMDILGHKMKIQLWDTAGQERFRTITHSYYKGAHGIVITFSLDNKESFNSVEGWLTQVKQNSRENISIILVGNKCDIFDRKVSMVEINTLKNLYNIVYFETSAKDCINVLEAFNTLATQVGEKFLEQELSIRKKIDAPSITNNTYSLTEDPKTIKKKKKSDCCK